MMSVWCHGVLRVEITAALPLCTLIAVRLEKDVEG